MEFKVSVYPLNFFLVNKTFKTNNTSFRGEKNESITNTIRKRKTFWGGKEFGKTYTQIADSAVLKYKDEV